MKLLIFFCLLPVGLFIIIGIFAGSSDSNGGQTKVKIKKHAKDGLNLQALTDLVRRVSNAKELEKELNESGNLINNLDLDEDEKVDYIKVTEVRQGKMRGFSFTVDVATGTKVEEQEVATVQLEKDDDDDYTRVQTHGNHHIYGNNHYYHQRYRSSNVGILGYMFSDHKPYRSHYGHNNYPSNFSSRKPIDKSLYSGFHQSKPYSSSVKRSSTSQVAAPFTSPNKTKVASNIKAPLKNPSTSQKSFQKSNPSRYISRSTTTSSRYGSSSSSRSGSFFGGGK